MILWTLGPFFAFFFGGISTHTRMPSLSYLLTQLSVVKHCLLKSENCASSGKMLEPDIFLCGALRQTCSVLQAPPTCTIYASSPPPVRSSRIFPIPANTSPAVTSQYFLSAGVRRQVRNKRERQNAPQNSSTSLTQLELRTKYADLGSETAALKSERHAV